MSSYYSDSQSTMPSTGYTGGFVPPGAQPAGNWWDSGFGSLVGANPIVSLMRGQGMFGGFSNLFNGGQQPTQAVGGPEDITNVNPYSDPFWQQLQGQGGNVWNQLMAGMNGQNQFYPGMQNAIGGIDPLAAQNYFMNNAAGGYRDMAGQNFDQFNTANQQLADRLSNQAIGNISSQFANRGAGALRSGGAMQAISEGAINPLLQSNAAIGQMIGGQAGQLQGQGMNELFNAYNTANQQRLGGWSALMGSGDQRDISQQGLLGGMYGQLLGQQGQMANPWLYQQQYMNNPNYMSIPGMINAGAQIAGAFM